MTTLAERALPVAPVTTASMRTSDGCRLDADVYRPAVPGRFPVLLMRQPYGRRIASTICYAHPSWYAAHGYVVVIQDVRGRGTSEGSFDLFAHEARDGAETVAWTAALAETTGAVGMYGFSYQGGTQLLAAAGSPPALKAIAPAMVGWNIREDVAYENGAFCLKAGMGWALQLAAESARRAGDAAAYAEIAAAVKALPLDASVVARPAILERYRDWTHYDDWIDRPAEDPYWAAISPAAYAGDLARAAVPTLFVGGWYDSHLRGTLAAYRALGKLGHPMLRLMVGPWAHHPWNRRVGALDLGEAAIGTVDQLQVRWFDRWLKDVANGIEREPSVRLFDIGLRAWRDFDGWPQSPCRFGLSGSGRAALDERDGVLTEGAGVGIETLVHDPWRPAPTVGGSAGVPPGPVDRRPVDARADVLTFTSVPLAEAFTVAGDVVARLRIASDAPDLDLACTLARVGRDGALINLAEGYARVAVPSGGVLAAVPMRATCATLAAGEALRLSIALASFPAFCVNPGTGADPTRTPQLEAQVVTLKLDCSTSSLEVSQADASTSYADPAESRAETGFRRNENP